MLQHNQVSRRKHGGPQSRNRLSTSHAMPQLGRRSSCFWSGKKSEGTSRNLFFDFFEIVSWLDAISRSYRSTAMVCFAVLFWICWEWRYGYSATGFPIAIRVCFVCFLFGIQDIKKDARFPSRLSGMQAVMLWVSNLSGKDNRALILKNFLLAWARVAQFALQKLSVYW